MQPMRLKKSETHKYIDNIVKNKYGYPAQIIAINEELSVLVGTFNKDRFFDFAEYGVWLIRNDFEYKSRGLAGFGTSTARKNAMRTCQTISERVIHALDVLSCGYERGIQEDYIASFLQRELIKYQTG